MNTQASKVEVRSLDIPVSTSNSPQKRTGGIGGSKWWHRWDQMVAAVGANGGKFLIERLPQSSQGGYYSSLSHFKLLSLIVAAAVVH